MDAQVRETLLGALDGAAYDVYDDFDSGELNIDDRDEELAHIEKARRWVKALEA